MPRRRTLRSLAAAAGTLLLAAPAGAPAAAPSATPRTGLWVPDGEVTAATVVGGRLWAAGDFTRVGPYTGGSARVDRTTGAPDPAWPDVSGTVDAVEPDGSGGAYLGGDFDAVGGAARGGLAHVLADGTVDPTFAPPAVGGTVKALELAGGRLYVGGSFNDVGGTSRDGFAAVDAATGALGDLAVPITSSGAPRSVETLAARVVTRFPAGRTVTLYVGGRFSTVAGAPRKGIARLVDDAFDVTWAPVVQGINDRVIVSAIVPTSDGAHLGGDFYKVNGVVRNGAALVSGAAGTTTEAWDPGLDVLETVQDMRQVAGGLLLAGHFTAVQGQARRNLALVDATTGAPGPFNPTGTGPAESTLHALLPDEAAGRLYAVGDAGSYAFDLASSDRLTWDPVGDGRAIAASGDRVVIGGHAAVAGGVKRDGLVELDLAGGRPTATRLAVQGRIFRTVRRMAAGPGGLVVVAGDFDTLTEDGAAVGSRQGLAAIDPVGGRWAPFNPPLGDTNPFNDLATDGARLLLGGTGTRALAAFGTTGAGTALTGDTPDGIVSGVAAGNGMVVAAGQFTSVTTAAGPVARTNVAAFAPGTGALTSWTAPAPNTPVSDVAIGNGVVYLGGDFTSIGGEVRENAAAVDAATGALLPFAPSGLRGVLRMDALDDRLLVATNGGLTLADLDGTSGATGTWRPIAERAGRIVRDLAVTPGGVVAAGRFPIQGAVRTANLAVFAIRPPAPQDVVAQAGDGSATVRFRLPGDGGAPLTGVTVTASPGGATATGPGDAPVRIDGLTNGTAYTFTVTATNARGTSAPSAPSAAVTPAATPSSEPPAGGGAAGDTGATGTTSANGGAATGDSGATTGSTTTTTTDDRADTRDRVAPALGGLRAGTLRRGRTGTLRLRLSEAARVIVELRTTRRPARRIVRVRRALPAGGAAVRLRVPRAARPGRYLLRITATDAAGNTAPARTVTVRVRG